MRGAASSVDGRFEGTGFWVAPGELLTCAHVVHGGKPITVDGRSAAGEPVTRCWPRTTRRPASSTRSRRGAAAGARRPGGHPCVRWPTAARPSVGPAAADGVDQ